MKIKLAKIDKTVAFDQLKKFVIEKIIEHNKVGAVIGLSGGVDSTLSAIIVKAAIDEYNKTMCNPLDFLGLIIPSDINNSASAADAKEVARRLNMKTRVIDIQEEINMRLRRFPQFNSPEYKTEKGNMISRVRAGVIHDIAGLENLLIIGTGNWGEDYCLGYYTRLGDGAVDINPLGFLPKRLVRQMATWLEFGDIAQKEPTAELEVGQTDFKDLGYSYDLNEIIIRGHIQGIPFDELCSHEQIKERAKNEILLYEHLFGNKKFYSISDMIKDMFRRLDAAQKKASWICPALPEELTIEYE